MKLSPFLPVAHCRGLFCCLHSFCSRSFGSLISSAIAILPNALRLYTALFFNMRDNVALDICAVFAKSVALYIFLAIALFRYSRFNLNIVFTSFVFVLYCTSHIIERLNCTITYYHAFKFYAILLNKTRLILLIFYDFDFIMKLKR